MNLDPSAASLLLSWRFDPLVWALALLAAGAYGRALWRSRRTPHTRAGWPLWRAVSFFTGLLVALLALESSAASLILNSMALYMGRLMLLAELAPPLLLLGLPRDAGTPLQEMPRRALAFLLDPFVAFALWATIVVFWNLPAGFNASLVSATAAGLLPSLYLLGGLLVWAVTLNALPAVRPVSLAVRGVFGFLSSLPMMVVAAVWLYSPQLLYSPYAGVPCLWSLTPLQNQQISGLVMMVAGLPAVGLALVQGLGGLLKLADSAEPPETVAEESGAR